MFPGAVYIIGSWYRQFETARRVSLFYMASLLSSGFGGIFAYALSLIRVGDGIYRQGWRWIYIIEGIATVVAGLVAPFFLVECEFSLLGVASLFYMKKSDLSKSQKELSG